MPLTCTLQIAGELSPLFIGGITGMRVGPTFRRAFQNGDDFKLSASDCSVALPLAQYFWSSGSNIKS